MNPPLNYCTRYKQSGFFYQRNLQQTYFLWLAIEEIPIIYQYLYSTVFCVYVVGLWCLTPLSTIFHIVAVCFIGGGNWCT
jgi:hypothetical protein